MKAKHAAGVSTSGIHLDYSLACKIEGGSWLRRLVMELPRSGQHGIVVLDEILVFLQAREDDQYSEMHKAAYRLGLVAHKTRGLADTLRRKLIWKANLYYDDQCNALLKKLNGNNADVRSGKTKSWDFYINIFHHPKLSKSFVPGSNQVSLGKLTEDQKKKIVKKIEARLKAREAKAKKTKRRR